MNATLSERILNKLWKRESIPYAILLAVVLWLGFILNSYKEEDGSVTYTTITFVSVVFGGSLLIYIMVCLIADSLPKASSGSIGVLFDVEAESDDIYESIKYKLADNFQNLATHKNAPPFDAVCVKRKKVQRYHKGGAESIIKLLEKTRCAIKVEVRCTVDDITKIENYELTINYDILDPSISEEAKRVLTEDVRPLGKTVEKLRFNKAETIDRFGFTAQTLVDICQYMVGFVYLLTGNIQEAISTLEQLKKALEPMQQSNERIRHLEELIDHRLFLCYNELVHSNFENFKKTKELAYLKIAQGALEEQNRLYPNTYAYCLNMAYISIALNRDYKTAKNCISMCKAVKYDYRWVYSDAFLSAYSGELPMVVKHKYENAFEHLVDDILDLIDYIEFVIEQEPDKEGLHLAVGFLYDAIGDKKQVKRHFSQFMAQYELLDNRTRKYLKGKMNTLQCGDQCDNDCLNCK